MDHPGIDQQTDQCTLKHQHQPMDQQGIEGSTKTDRLTNHQLMDEWIHTPRLTNIGTHLLTDQQRTQNRPTAEPNQGQPTETDPGNNERQIDGLTD